MQITIELPGDIATHSDPGREALESLVIQGYRTGVLKHHESATLLGMGRLEFDHFLHCRGIQEHSYGLEDLSQDVASLDKLHFQGHLRS